MTEPKAPQNVPPQAILGQLINGYWATMAIHAAAKLEIADRLASGPIPVSELARQTGTHEEALFRLLRGLAGLGIFQETDPRTFAQTPLSDALRTDVPGSMHGLAVMTGILHMKAWPQVVHSVKTGETAFEHVTGKPIFDYLAENPDAARVFDSAFSGYTAMTSEAVARAYDFSAFSRIVDVGGGSGAFAAAILARHPSARGVTFDLPHVAGRAREFLASRGVADRCEAVSGDFFEAVPEGGDAYLLKMILHDWDDARCVTILENVRRAIAPNGRLLVVESVVPEGNGPSPSKLLDVNMLVMTGGKERTEKQYAALFRAGGFELARVSNAGPTDVVEARPS